MYALIFDTVVLSGNNSPRRCQQQRGRRRKERQEERKYRQSTLHTTTQSKDLADCKYRANSTIAIALSVKIHNLLYPSLQMRFSYIFVYLADSIFVHISIRLTEFSTLSQLKENASSDNEQEF